MAVLMMVLILPSLNSVFLHHFKGNTETHLPVQPSLKHKYPRPRQVGRFLSSNYTAKLMRKYLGKFKFYFTYDRMAEWKFFIYYSGAG